MQLEGEEYGFHVLQPTNLNKKTLKNLILSAVVFYIDSTDIHNKQKGEYDNFCIRTVGFIRRNSDIFNSNPFIPK